MLRRRPRRRPSTFSIIKADLRLCAGGSTYFVSTAVRAAVIHTGRISHKDQEFNARRSRPEREYRCCFQWQWRGLGDLNLQAFPVLWAERSQNAERTAGFGISSGASAIGRDSLEMKLTERPAGNTVYTLGRSRTLIIVCCSLKGEQVRYI